MGALYRIRRVLKISFKDLSILPARQEKLEKISANFKDVTPNENSSRTLFVLSCQSSSHLFILKAARWYNVRYNNIFLAHDAHVLCLMYCQQIHFAWRRQTSMSNTRTSLHVKFSKFSSFQVARERPFPISCLAQLSRGTTCRKITNRKIMPRSRPAFLCRRRECGSPFPRQRTARMLRKYRKCVYAHARHKRFWDRTEIRRNRFREN